MRLSPINACFLFLLLACDWFVDTQFGHYAFTHAMCSQVAVLNLDHDLQEQYRDDAASPSICVNLLALDTYCPFPVLASFLREKTTVVSLPSDLIYVFMSIQR
jgi:hypothetical protein